MDTIYFAMHRECGERPGEGWCPEIMGFKAAAVWSQGKARVFWERDLRDLISQLKAASVVIGFGVRVYELPALSAYPNAELTGVRFCDIQVELQKLVGNRIDLDAIYEGDDEPEDRDEIPPADRERKPIDVLCVERINKIRRLYDRMIGLGKVEWRDPSKEGRQMVAMTCNDLDWQRVPVFMGDQRERVLIVGDGREDLGTRAEGLAASRAYAVRVVDAGKFSAVAKLTNPRAIVIDARPFRNDHDYLRLALHRFEDEACAANASVLILSRNHSKPV